ncbi:phage tail protein [Acinetobacter pittii]|uniref:phage tail protein n=1 Tax=Acinetobacter pittii TaxID=48296 RepID=UPI0025B29F4F|nr:phage tail protein [Acinetobacter pittii]MDN4021508.1 phage tail protein [Acinetobacter pittii]
MNQITVYQTNYSGLFVGETVADESPLEPGVFAIPAGCVETAPPEEWPEDKWPRFNGKGWDLIPKPKVPEPISPEQKLAEFLKNNPDVAALIEI